MSDTTPIEPKINPYEPPNPDGSVVEEPKVEEVEMSDVVEPEDDSKFAFDAGALAGLKMGGMQPSGGMPSAGVGDLSLIDYYNRTALLAPKGLRTPLTLMPDTLYKSRRQQRWDS
jgi:hypothetical protein